METRTVIQNLVADLRPVTPLPSRPFRLAQWLAATVLCSVMVIAVIGTRGDLATAVLTASFHAHSWLLALAAIGSALAALTLAVPGERLSWIARRIPTGAALAWIGWLAAELTGDAARGGEVWAVAASWGCMAKALAVGLVPALLLSIMIGRAAPLHWQRPVTFAALAGAAVGALGVELTCPMNNPMHLLLWHAAPAALIVLAASAGCWVVLTVIDRLEMRR